MARGDLTDTEWERLEPLLPSREGKQGRPYSDHRRMLNGMLWVLRTGAPWRDLPERYGSWHSVYSRFRRWSRAGVFQRIEAAVIAEEDAKGAIDWESMAIDGSYIKVHPHACGARQEGGPKKTTRRSARSVRAGVG
jgi:transposase